MDDFNPKVDKKYRDKTSNEVFEVEEIDGDDIVISHVDSDNVKHNTSREMLRRCYDPV